MFFGRHNQEEGTPRLRATGEASKVVGPVDGGAFFLVGQFGNGDDHAVLVELIVEHLLLCNDLEFEIWQQHDFFFLSAEAPVFV